MAKTFLQYITQLDDYLKEGMRGYRDLIYNESTFRFVVHMSELTEAEILSIYDYLDLTKLKLNKQLKRKYTSVLLNLTPPEKRVYSLRDDSISLDTVALCRLDLLEELYLMDLILCETGVK